jgi:hypothetical protein
MRIRFRIKHITLMQILMWIGCGFLFDADPDADPGYQNDADQDPDADLDPNSDLQCEDATL